MGQLISVEQLFSVDLLNYSNYSIYCKDYWKNSIVNDVNTSVDQVVSVLLFLMQTEILNQRGLMVSS